MLKLTAILGGVALFVFGSLGALSINPTDRAGGLIVMGLAALGLLVANLSTGKPAIISQWLLVVTLALIALFFGILLARSTR